MIADAIGRRTRIARGSRDVIDRREHPTSPIESDRERWHSAPPAPHVLMWVVARIPCSRHDLIASTTSCKVIAIDEGPKSRPAGRQRSRPVTGLGAVAAGPAPRASTRIPPTRRRGWRGGCRCALTLAAAQNTRSAASASANASWSPRVDAERTPSTKLECVEPAVHASRESTSPRFRQRRHLHGNHAERGSNATREAGHGIGADAGPRYEECALRQTAREGRPRIRAADERQGPPARAAPGGPEESTASA